MIQYDDVNAVAKTLLSIYLIKKAHFSVYSWLVI